jgi:glyoxylase-like metal-dependent hydrolase (beta-lactamase superfamily II)
MKRKDFLRNVAMLSAGAVLLPKLSYAQESPFTELRGGVGMFSMQGGTIGWYTSPEGIIAIDSQYADPAAQFVDGISGFGGGPEKVLFNTHHHGDHTGGNAVFAENSYRIIAHQNVPDLQQAGARDGNTPTVASITYSDDFAMDLPGETVHAKYYGRAHTGGDSVIWFENANVAHMGDLVFNRLYPFIDRNGGALIENWITLLETVAGEAEPDTIFIFGHGNPEFGVTGTREDLLAKRDFLAHLLEFTQNGINAGKSLEELQETISFEEFPDVIAPSNFLSLSRNIEAAYGELTEG